MLSYGKFFYIRYQNSFVFIGEFFIRVKIVFICIQNSERSWILKDNKNEPKTSMILFYNYLLMTLNINFSYRNNWKNDCASSGS